jgi:uncharacterized BrkB/YihY/UPF0761 family membrane protein
MNLKRIFNLKTIITLLILIGFGYLVSKFPDQSVVFGGIGIIILIGIWLLQAEKEQE